MNTRSIRKPSTWIALVAGVLGVVSCDGNEDQAAWWGGEQQRIELSQQLELKKFRFDQVVTRDFEEFEALRRLAASNAGHLETLRQRRNALDDQVASLQARRAEFRLAAVNEQRQRAIGQSFETLNLVSGRNFEKVTVSAIDDSGVTIRHSVGSARLRFNDLDAGQRLFFGLEADLAVAAAERESQNAVDYERWIDGQMAAIDDKKQKQSADARREQLETQRNYSDLAARQLAASSSRPLAQTGMSLSSSPTRYSSSYSRYRTYRPSYRYVYYNDTPSWSCHSAARPVLTRYGARAGAPGYVAPSSVPRRQSFAETTLPSIP